MEDQLKRELPQLVPRLWRFALRLTRDHADAEDLVQRTYVRALERRHQWQAGTSLISWLFSIMHSIWMNELRSAQRRREQNLDADESFDNLPINNADPEYQMLCQQVVNAVQALPEAQRVVLMLVAVEGLSYQEAADILNIPIGTVMSRLSRGRLTIGQQFLGTESVSSFVLLKSQFTGSAT